MKSPVPKVLHPLCGRPMIAWVMDQALALEPDKIVLVVGHGSERVEQAARRAVGEGELVLVEQEPQLGTGHALQVALPAIEGRTGPVIVLYGDMPLLRPESLQQLVAARAELGAGGTALMTAWLDEPRGYGRILRDSEDAFQGIVEERDATPEQRAIGELNLGMYAFDGPSLCAALPRLSNDNDQGEYYLTDVLALAVQAGQPVETVELEDPVEAEGINTLAQLAEVRFELQMRILEKHLAAGVYIEDPATTYIDHGVTIGRGTKILPCTVIRSGVTIGEECEVGPFTHLRKGTLLADHAEVGNFTECKNTSLGRGTKAKHLSYLGDAVVGERTNIGAGTIFANYDGTHKHETIVGDEAFVGSGTIIVAPNEIPDRSTTGAGAVLTRSAAMAEGETWIGLPARKHPAKETS